MWWKLNIQVIYGPTIEEFHGNHRGKVVTLWYNDLNHRMHQPQQKTYKKRGIKQTKTELWNFNVASVSEDSYSGSDNNDVDFD